MEDRGHLQYMHRLFHHVLKHSCIYRHCMLLNKQLVLHTILFHSSSPRSSETKIFYHLRRLLQKSGIPKQRNNMGLEPITLWIAFL
jgi:hypothetical protein